MGHISCNPQKTKRGTQFRVWNTTHLQPRKITIFSHCGNRLIFSEEIAKSDLMTPRFSGRFTYY